MHCGRRYAVLPLRVCYDCEFELSYEPLAIAWNESAEQRFFNPEDEQAVATEDAAFATLIEFLSSRKVRENPAPKAEHTTVDDYHRIRAQRLAGDLIGHVGIEFRRRPRTVDELRAAFRGVDADVELVWERDGTTVKPPYSGPQSAPWWWIY